MLFFRYTPHKIIWISAYKPSLSHKERMRRFLFGLCAKHTVLYCTVLVLYGCYLSTNYMYCVYTRAIVHVTSCTSTVSRVGHSIIGFSVESIVFCDRRSKDRLDLENSIDSITFDFFKDRRERINPVDL